MVLCIHNSDIMTRINSLYGSQTSTVILCMQNNVISIRNTPLYGSLPSSAVFACETATLGPELQVSMGPRPHLWLFCNKSSDFSTRIASLYWSQPSSVVFECKTRLLDLNSKSLWVPDLTYSFVHAKQRDY